MVYRPRLTLLMGAGASVQFGVSTVWPLTEELNKRTLADGWVQHEGGDKAVQVVIDRLTAMYGDPKEVHFERIYHVVNRLMQHARDPQLAVPEFRPVLHPFFSGLPPEFTKRALRAVERAYLRHLFAIIWEQCRGADVSPISSFLSALRRSYNVRIYSLNYDDLVHRACPDLMTGFPRSGRSARRFDSESFFARRDEDSLFYLHGSIHLGYAPDRSAEFAELFWFDDVDEAIKGADYIGSGRDQADGTSIERSPLITGLEKSSSVLTVPHSFYFSELLRDVMTSDVLVIIGYGLGDPHVNEHLRSARASPNPPKLIVIDYFNWMEMFSSNGFKVRQLGHVTKVPVFEDISIPAGPQPGWRHSKAERAAVWNMGFVEFMKATPDLTEIASAI